MAKTKVTTPDGKSFLITHKDGVSKDTLAAYVNNVAYPRAAAEEAGPFDFIVDAFTVAKSGAVRGFEESVAGLQQGAANIARYGANAYYDLLDDLYQDAENKERVKVGRERTLRDINQYEDVGEMMREPVQKFAQEIRNSRFLEQDNAAANVALEVTETVARMAPVLTTALLTKRPVAGIGADLLNGAQAMSEAKRDMEQALGKEQEEFTLEERQQLADVTTAYAAGSTLLFKFISKPALGLDRVSGDTLRKFLKGEIKLPAGKLKSLLNVVKAGGGEAIEETAQGQFLDTLAAFSYDDDRKLVGKEVLNERMHEAMIAFFAGGSIRGVGEIGGAIGNMKLPTAKTQEVSEEQRKGMKTFKVKYTATQKEKGREDAVFDREDTFEAKTLEEAQQIIDESVKKKPGVDAESIVIEEVQPTVEPEVKDDTDFLDDPTLSNQEKIQKYYESLTDEELQRMIEKEETAAFSLEQFKSLRDEVTKPDVYEAELAQQEKSYEGIKKNAERAKAVLEARKQKPVDTVDPQKTGAEIPLGVFGDVDLDTVPGLTPQQKKKITELRQEANAEARKIFGALDDPTGQLDSQAVAEGLEALRQISEEGTVGATAQQKQFFDKIRDIERRQAEILGREYIPRTDESIVREVRNTIVRTPLERVTPTFFVGATRYMKPTSVRTAQAVRDWKKNPNLADSSQTKKAISELKRPDNKDVISMVRELLSLYDIGNGRVRVYRGAQEDSDVKVLSGWSLNPEIASDFQEQARDFGEGEITVATIPIKDVLYKDNTIFDDDAVFQEQELIFDTVENLVIEKQTTDNIKDTFTPKVKEEEAIIKSYRMMPAQQVFDEEGMYDPRLTEEDPFPPIEEHGEVAVETVDGESLADAPVVGASVNLPNAPQISRKDFKGKKGFFFFSDRTRVGDYTGLFPEDGINIKLQGGPAYAFIQKNLDKLAGWAFTSENIFSKFLDKVKATDGIGFITLYKKENLRANGTFLKAYVAEVKAAIKAKRITTKQFLEAANTAREQVVNLKSKDAKTGKITFTVARDGRGYKLFSKPFKSVDAFEKAMELVGFEPRGKMFDASDKSSTVTLTGKELADKEAELGIKYKIGNRINPELTLSQRKLFKKTIKFPGELKGGRLGSITNIKKGLPDIVKMIDLFTDPTLEGRDRGDVIGAVQFDKEQTSSTTAKELGTEEHLSYPLVIKGKGIGAFSDPTNVLDVVQIDKRRNEALRSAETSMPTGTVGATDQQGKTDAQRSVIDTAVADAQKLSGKLDVKIVADNTINRPAQYNYETQTIQYNPQLLASRGKEFTRAAMREEVIHAAMHKVIMRRNPKLSAKAAFEKAMSSIGSDLTQEQKDLMSEVYGELGTDLNYGAEYTRFAVQHILDGKTTEGTLLFSGKAFEKLQSLIKSVQSYVTKILGPELKTNEEAAFIIADTLRLLRSVDPDAKPAQQKIISEAEAILSGTAQVDSYVYDNPYASEAEKKRRISETKRRKRAAVLQTASSFFKRIHGDIATLLSDYYTRLERRQTDAVRQINNFQTKIRGIKNEKDRNRLKQLFSSTSDPNTADGRRIFGERDNLLRKYNLYNDFKLLIRPLLDQLRLEAIASGFDVKYLFEYFPMKVKDLGGLLSLYGKDIENDFDAQIKKINKERKDNGELQLNEDEIAAQFIVYLNNQMYKKNLGEKTPGFLKKRKGGMLSQEELKFYEDPEVALGSYVNSIIVKTEEARMFGNKALQRNKEMELDGESTYRVNLSDPQGELSRLVARLYSEGQLDKRQMGDLFFGLDQMFGPPIKGKEQESNMRQFGRLASYGSLLVDPTTTLSQLYDLAFMALDNPNVLRIAKTIVTEKDFSLEMAGIDPTLMSAEFRPNNEQRQRRLEKAVKFGLKSVGFTQLDKLMKETNLTVNYNRYRRISKRPKNSKEFKKFRSEVEFMVGPQDAERTINDFRNGVYDSPYVRELVVRKLLETQPVNAFEMPMAVRKNPNLRMWYTMKSFIIKQANLVNDRMISKILSRTASREEKRKAIFELIYLIFLFQMAGIPIDFIKDMIAGRDVYPEDYVENAFFRLFGMSKYNMYILKERGPAEFGISYIAPVPIMQAVEMSKQIYFGGKKVVEGDFESEDAQKIARTLLPYDSLWYYGYGPGAESQRERRTRESRERGRVPLIYGDPVLQFNPETLINLNLGPRETNIYEPIDLAPYFRNQ